MCKILGGKLVISKRLPPLSRSIVTNLRLPALLFTA